MESTKEYIKLFNACPIKVGDTVRVLRGWKDGEYGYYGYVCWNDYDPDAPRLDVDFVVTGKYDDCYQINNKDDTWYVSFFVLEVVGSAPVNTATSDDYLAFHNASGLKVRDKVKITRKAKDREMGWNADWDSAMNVFIGEIGEIVEDYGNNGWEVKCFGNTWLFPTFILQ